jgi:cytochrome P450
MSSTLYGLSDNFAFHASPEAFIQLHTSVSRDQDPHPISNHTPLIRTKLLNRNVIIVSSYQEIRRILSGPWEEAAPANCADSSPYSAAGAYAMLMGPFFPAPNLLLADDNSHAKLRSVWERVMTPSTQIGPLVTYIVKEHFNERVGSTVDLYASLKVVAWKILLRLFLDLEDSDSAFSEVQSLQEDLLRGQFSLFPVSINFGFWQSSRRRGLESKAKLQHLIAERLFKPRRQSYLFSRAEMPSATDEEDILSLANHILLFTSSLAVKALASLMTAVMLNIFLFTRSNLKLNYELARMRLNDKQAMLQSIQLETERLSPPIVGLMRRAVRDTTISFPSDDIESTPVPKGWDVWLYFVHAGRDSRVFGYDAEQFVPNRFCGDMTGAGEPFAFSIGRKTCLGQNIMREVCLTLAETMLDQGIQLDGNVEDKGVLAWLGWGDEATAEDWKRDIQQLPVQHPRRSIMVRINKSNYVSDP